MIQNFPEKSLASIDRIDDVMSKYIERFSEKTPPTLKKKNSL